MTNKDKFLKDGVSVEELASKINQYCYNNKALAVFSTEELINMFFNDRVQPALTEDERVILRNIDVKNYDIIGKNSLGVTFITSTKDSDKFIWVNNVFAKKLFQFIKERRRIRDS